MRLAPKACSATGGGEQIARTSGGFVREGSGRIALLRRPWLDGGVRPGRSSGSARFRRLPARAAETAPFLIRPEEELRNAIQGT